MAVRRLSLEELGVVETDLSSLLGQLDITLSALRDALRETLTDVDEKAASLLDQLDITLSGLRDSLRGAGSKDFSTLEADLETLNTTLGSRSAWTCGLITVTTAGTPVQGPNQAVAPGKELCLVYYPTNTGRIGVGHSSASANLATGTPIVLAGSGQSIILKITNVNLIWVDADINGEKLMWFCEV